MLQWATVSWKVYAAASVVALATVLYT